MDKRREPPREEAEGGLAIEGRNAVLEALRAGTALDAVYLPEGELRGPLLHILNTAAARGAAVRRVSRGALDTLSKTGAHQGVVALASAVEYAAVEDMLLAAAARGEKPLIVLCDHIEDPQNLGAIIRSAEVAGAHGVVIPKKRSAQVTPAVVRASAGAALHMPIARVPNLAAAVDELKSAGVWVFGADAEAETPLYEADFKGASALALGSEGAGLSRLIREKCDFAVSIPVLGKINSLNASAAAAVLLFEAVRQRFSA